MEVITKGIYANYNSFEGSGTLRVDWQIVEKGASLIGCYVAQVLHIGSAKQKYTYIM